MIAGIFRDRPKAASIGRRQREAIEILRAAPDGIDATDLKERGIGAQTLTTLASLGLVAIGRRRVDRDPFKVRIRLVRRRPC